MAQKTVQEEKPLVVPDEQQLRKELDLLDPTEIKVKTGQDRTLDKKAEELVGQLIDISENDQEAMGKSRAAVEDFALDLQRKTSQQSAMLKKPIKELSNRSREGGEVANALINLKVTVEDLDPSRIDLSPGWFSRLLGHIPGVGTSLKRYFSRFESAQTVLSAIVRSLEMGREQLKRDNITLQEDQKRMRELTQRLEKAIRLAQLMDQKLVRHVEGKLSGNPAMAKFVNEEVLFPLRQRIMDLQQQLAVSQQGIIAMEVIIRNNKELVRGVNRALMVTVNALEVAVTVALALNDQRVVLDKIGALTSTTNDLIRGTAERLKTQGVEIHKQASSAQLDVEALKSAFSDIKTAMEDISRFRSEALPRMAGTILELDKLTSEAEESIEKLEKGNRVKPSFHLDVD